MGQQIQSRQYCLYNYVTCEDDNREFPATFAETRAYVPQYALDLLDIHEEIGTPLLEAMKNVLMVCIGERQSE